MKNLKTKIGTSLAALTFFATVGFVPKNALAVKLNPLYIFGASEEKNVDAKYKPNSNVEKLVNTLFTYPDCNNYILPGGKTVKFEFYGSKGDMNTAHFSVDIIKEAEVGGEVETVRIRDCHLDGLGKDDLVGYKMENKHATNYEPKFEFREFDKLSKEAKEKIRKEYNKIIEEAPSNIVKKYRTKESQKLNEENEKRERFEKNILGILEDGNGKINHENKFSCWIIA